MTALPDPRCFSAGAADGDLLRLALESAAGDGAATGALRTRVRQLLEAADDAALHKALRAAPTGEVYRELWQAIRTVAEASPTVAESGTSIVARPFAIPLVFVAGARRAATVPGIVPDIGEVRALLEAQGAVGVTRNFGLSAALVAPEALERIPPSLVYRWNAAYTGGTIEGMAGVPIEVAPGREQAHLRFLLGAGIAPSHLPSFLETAADIGRWGAAFTRTLARQLAQSGLDLLPLARPPQALLDAAHGGRRAVLDVAFQLFASHAIRMCRMSAGEPVVIVSAHREAGAAELRISVSSLLDDALLEGFRWPLHPLDDLGDIASSIADLLDACRVGDVRWMPQVVTGTLAAGAATFVSAREFDRVAALPACH